MILMQSEVVFVSQVRSWVGRDVLVVLTADAVCCVATESGDNASESGSMRFRRIPPSILKVRRMTRVCQKGVPERRCTAHSMGKLCVIRHINARIVISRRDNGSVAMMAIGA
jgi:hypothetical protein